MHAVQAGIVLVLAGVLAGIGAVMTVQSVTLRGAPLYARALASSAGLLVVALGVAAYVHSPIPF